MRSHTLRSGSERRGWPGGRSTSTASAQMVDPGGCQRKADFAAQRGTMNDVGKILTDRIRELLDRYRKRDEHMYLGAKYEKLSVRAR